MESKPGVVALIPARGGSKSIPLKNIRYLNGRPLIFWTIDAAVNCSFIDKVYISTDSVDIQKKVDEYKENPSHENSYKLEVIGRSPYTATDTASTESVMMEFLQNYSFEHMVLIQATNPLLQSYDLEEAFNKYFSQGYDSMLSLVRQKRFVWEESGKTVNALNYDPLHRPRRQEFSGYLVENGAFYITTRTGLEETQCRLSGVIGHYEMPEETYFEIDEPGDWVIVEELMKKNRGGSCSSIQAKAAKVKLLAMDCDGVLTDAGMYYSESGDELKKFNTKDGMGISLLQKKGIIIALITGENRELVCKRAAKLHIDEVHMGVADKLKVMQDIQKKYGLDWEEIAYIGDDINDLEVLQKVGLAVSVADGMTHVKQAAHFITEAKGGQGAVREVCEVILSTYTV